MARAVTDSEIIDLVKEIEPTRAYIMGFNDCAGKLQMSSQENIDHAKRKIIALRARAQSDSQKKVLDSMLTRHRYDEPQPVLDDLIEAAFGLLAKEGVNDEHLLTLFENAAKTIDASKERYAGRSVPIGVKVLTLYRLDGVKDVINTVKTHTKNAQLKAACDIATAKAEEYVKMFDVEGFGKGEFTNVEKIFRKHRFDLGRQKFYLEALNKGMGYEETPDELERKALEWIDEELPKFRRVTSRLARKFGCDPDPQVVEERINSRMKLDPKKLFRTTVTMRKVIQKFVNADVHGINPKYTTRVLETPDYLSGIYPTGGALFLDTLTKKPFQLYFQTVDPKRDPDKSVAALIDLLVHEEYGHCVHHSNSVAGIVGKVPMMHLMASTHLTGPITEGLSFNRELEFLEASKALEKKKHLSKAERDYVALLEKYGGLKTINEELEFMTRRWRLVRFLRVVGDVRVNTGKQGLIEFVDWANEHAGVPRSSMYNQLFPAHEGIFPGYATTYAVVGQEIRAMQQKIKDPRDRYKFSTYLCSIGFPPRSTYRKMLRDYASKLN